MGLRCRHAQTCIGDQIQNGCFAHAVPVEIHDETIAARAVIGSLGLDTGSWKGGERRGTITDRRGGWRRRLPQPSAGAAGADALVAGSAVFKGGSVDNTEVYGRNIAAIRAAAEAARIKSAA